MERQGEPTWQPISALGLTGGLIDAQVDGGRDQYETLLRTGPTPSTTPRSRGCSRPTATRPTTCGSTTSSSPAGTARRSIGSQRREVEHLQAQMAELHKVVEQILALGAPLKDETIEVLLAKSDVEVA